MNCVMCGAYASNSHKYCERCEDIIIARSIKRAEWKEFHDEPCPEAELTQFPKYAKEKENAPT